MLYPGGLGSVRTCHRITLADFGYTEGFDRSGKEDRLYAFQLSEGVYIRKDVTLEGVGSLTFGELSDLDTSHAVPKQIHTLAFTGSMGANGCLCGPGPTNGLVYLHKKLFSACSSWRRAQSPGGGE